jgi:hypothetical protein
MMMSTASGRRRRTYCSTSNAASAARAEKDVALQLSRAGVRLAAVLNKALGKQVSGER